MTEIVFFWQYQIFYVKFKFNLFVAQYKWKNFRNSWIEIHSETILFQLFW